MSAKQTKRLSKIKIKRVARKEAENLISVKKHQSEKSTDNHIEENIQEHEDLNQCSNANSVDSDSFHNLNDESESEENVFNLCEGHVKWAIQFQLSFVAINALLLLLLKCNIKVPKDARILFRRN